MKLYLDAPARTDEWLDDLDATDRRLARMVWEATNLAAREAFEAKHWNGEWVDDDLDTALDEMQWVCDFIEVGLEGAEENTPAIEPALGLDRFKDWVHHVAETAPDWATLGYTAPAAHTSMRDPWLRRVERLTKVLTPE
ncbi:MAG: hypothetical protein CL902_00015 [Dehalococcoidia bacterium]|nr:hypothetical protein [Dehalococcoidia bacterium]